MTENVKRIQYNNTNENSVTITLQSGQTIITSYPCNTWHQQYIDEWENAGNSIKKASTTPLSKLKAQKVSEIQEAFVSALASGMKYTFPNGQEDTIQLRQVDQQNLTALSIKASKLINRGEPETQMTFRAASNGDYKISAQQMNEMTETALDYVSALYGKVWNLKDKARNVTKKSDLKDITWNE